MVNGGRYDSSRYTRDPRKKEDIELGLVHLPLVGWHQHNEEILQEIQAILLIVTNNSHARIPHDGDDVID